jgi:hypothetical protein
MGYGPDNDNELIFGHALLIVVPPGATARVSFAFQVARHNAIIIYRADDLSRLAERGNYGRSVDEWASPRNDNGRPRTYLVTGWHKHVGPDGAQPWLQSTGRQVLASPTGPIHGFEDPSDADYNDAVAIVRVVHR